MTDYYLDSSALVKRYVVETGSAWVSSLFDFALNNEIFIGAVTSVEIIAAITRRTRRGTITAPDAAAARSLFRTDLLFDYQIVEITDIVINRAMLLAELHELRGYDALQLAAASEINSFLIGSGLPPITFISADNDLNAAALSEGLIVDNPDAHE